MSDTRQKILDDIKVAMKSGDKQGLATLRLISAAIKQREVDERVELDEPNTISVLDKLMKQRRESIAQYSKAGRDDLVAQEQIEAELIETYLPAQLSADEVTALIDAAISESGAASVKDMGKVMAIVKPKMQGKADMSSVSQSIKARLNG